jgi:hypothetical protein
VSPQLTKNRFHALRLASLSTPLASLLVRVRHEFHDCNDGPFSLSFCREVFATFEACSLAVTGAKDRKKKHKIKKKKRETSSQQKIGSRPIQKRKGELREGRSE